MTTPAFRITAAGEDVSGRIGDRLLSLSVTDEDGEKADRLEIEIDDRDGRVALPDMEAELQESEPQWRTVQALHRMWRDALAWSKAKGP